MMERKKNAVAGCRFMRHCVTFSIKNDYVGKCCVVHVNKRHFARTKTKTKKKTIATNSASQFNDD